MCKNEKTTHGTAATGVPVAEMLASEARQPPPGVDVNLAYGDPSLCLFPGDRSRESCGTLATPSNHFLCGRPIWPCIALSKVLHTVM